MKTILKFFLCLTLVMLVKTGFVPAVFSADQSAVAVTGKNVQTPVDVREKPVEADGTVQTQAEAAESATKPASNELNIEVQTQKPAAKPANEVKVEVQTQKPAAKPADQVKVEVQAREPAAKPADEVKVEVQAQKPAAKPANEVNAAVTHQQMPAVSAGAATGMVGHARLEATNADGVLTGDVSFVEHNGGLQVDAEVFNVPVAGSHGFHIHEVGACHRNGDAAGGHYNPLGIKHGFLPKDGHQAAHLGDMGNIEVDAKGHGKLSVFLPGVSLNSGEYAVGGRAVILHEKADDFSQPTGNAGGRIGCGIIEVGQNSGE